MDREKAIQILKRCEAESHCGHYKRHYCCIGCGQREALDLAIEALGQMEIEKSCDTCKHRKLYECGDCRFASKWEVPTDYISRQQAIESLDRIGSLDTEADREYARDIFRSISPVTPTERTGEWVRCEDRLPDEIGTYLVSGKMKYDTDKEYEYFVDMADYTKVEHCDYMGKFGGFFQTCNDWYEGQQEYEILAWKPLPEPYRRGEI